ncbi:MAG: hypothetical protein ACO260_09725, partial [Hylemonella sp.]
MQPAVAPLQAADKAVCAFCAIVVRCLKSDFKVTWHLTLQVLANVGQPLSFDCAWLTRATSILTA